MSTFASCVSSNSSAPVRASGPEYVHLCLCNVHTPLADVLSRCCSAAAASRRRLLGGALPRWPDHQNEKWSVDGFLILGK